MLRVRPTAHTQAFSPGFKRLGRGTYDNQPYKPDAIRRRRTTVPEPEGTPQGTRRSGNGAQPLASCSQPKACKSTTNTGLDLNRRRQEGVSVKKMHRVQKADFAAQEHSRRREKPGNAKKIPTQRDTEGT